MKSILAICAVVLVTAVAVLAWKLSNRADHHGKPFAGLPAAAIADITAKPDAFVGRQVTIRGKLKQHCPATGCWFYLVDPADSKAHELKVEMGDTTPRLPARIGKLAQVEGQLIKYGEDYEFIGVAVTFSEGNKP
jgi:hypothetical protein